MLYNNDQFKRQIFAEDGIDPELANFLFGFDTAEYEGQPAVDDPYALYPDEQDYQSDSIDFVQDQAVGAPFNQPITTPTAGPEEIIGGADANEIGIWDQFANFAHENIASPQDFRSFAGNILSKDASWFPGDNIAQAIGETIKGNIADEKEAEKSKLEYDRDLGLRAAKAADDAELAALRQGLTADEAKLARDAAYQQVIDVTGLQQGGANYRADQGNITTIDEGDSNRESREKIAGEDRASRETITRERIVSAEKIATINANITAQAAAIKNNLAKDATKTELTKEFRTSFAKDQVVNKAIGSQSGFYTVYSLLSEDGSGLGDIAALTAFLKTIDPESVARESELQGAADGQGVAEKLKVILDKIDAVGDDSKAGELGKYLSDVGRADLLRIVKLGMAGNINAHEQVVAAWQENPYFKDSKVNIDGVVLGHEISERTKKLSGYANGSKKYPFRFKDKEAYQRGINMGIFDPSNKDVRTVIGSK